MLLDFELDPKIIHHIIFNQAGSLGKGLIELVMNCVDANAKSVKLVVTETTFSCSDDGAGFATREDVLRYFGRFGTPHIEGDATYGRFRLGRGQIMAYARTKWVSNSWEMKVDTQKWGYKYELDDLNEQAPGCHIEGEWYDPLNDMELLSTCQEIRDLIRYTPIQVELNGKIISKNPEHEKWDAEDDFAYYRVKAEGAVSIYNQGVLVRHDSAHLWGAGGMIVSKKAIDLNVSRTEILRKSCPVWKHIASTFQSLANKYVSQLGDRRKTEARREKAARSLLAGDPDIHNIFNREEVITILPGKRHITLDQFLRICQYNFKCKTTVLGNDLDMAKGEALAHSGVTQVIHWSTLDRFGCHSVTEFGESLGRIYDNLRSVRTQSHRQRQYPEIEFMDFQTLKEAYVERTCLVQAKDVLDKETRRLWTALAWCLSQYAALCTGGEDRYYGGRIFGGQIKCILLGQSDTADGWTDGHTYIAINEKIVQRLKTEPMQVASLIFSIVDHEISHEGDSIESGHDDAFYQRFHDQTLQYSEQRQWYIRMFLRKYVTSLEGEGKRMKGNAYRDVWLESRAGNGRKQKGLPSAYGETPVTDADLHAEYKEDSGFINLVNSKIAPVVAPEAQTDWDSVKDKAVQVASEKALALKNEWDAQDVLFEEWAEEWGANNEDSEREWKESREGWLTRLAAAFQTNPEEVPDEYVEYFANSCPVADQYPEQQFQHELTTFEYIKQILCLTRGMTMESIKPDAILDAWFRGIEVCGLDEWKMLMAENDNPSFAGVPHPIAREGGNSWMDRYGISPEIQLLVQEGEDKWSLERNAAAAGFWRIEDYLIWRSES